MLQHNTSQLKLSTTETGKLCRRSRVGQNLRKAKQIPNVVTQVSNRTRRRRCMTPILELAPYTRQISAFKYRTKPY